MKVVLAKAHFSHLENEETKNLIKNISDALETSKIDYAENAINFVFVKGDYDHFERKMETVCLFVNKLHKSISELHGELKLSFAEKKAQIAKATINFDSDFLGALNHDEALMVSLNIPVKGLTENEEFGVKDVKGLFGAVRVTDFTAAQ